MYVFLLFKQLLPYLYVYLQFKQYICLNFTAAKRNCIRYTRKVHKSFLKKCIFLLEGTLNMINILNKLYYDNWLNKNYCKIDVDKINILQLRINYWCSVFMVCKNIMQNNKIGGKNATDLQKLI